MAEKAPQHCFETSLRVETATERLGFHTGSLAEQWRECTVRWGSLSPAALGCLLEFVRGAWGDEGVTTLRVDSGAPTKNRRGMWTVYGDDRRMLCGYCETESEALVAALEAAP